MNRISSGFGEIPKALNKFAFGALACTALTDLSARVAVSASALCCGTYLTFRGIKNFYKNEYKKGACEILTGVGLIGMAGMLAYSNTNNQPKPENTSSLTNLSVNAQASPSQPTGATILTSLGAAGAAWLTARNPMNRLRFGHNQWCPSIELRINQVKQLGKEFAQKVSAVLKTGGKIKRLISCSGTYMILNSVSAPSALFKPDDERNFGPANPGYPGQKMDDPTTEDIIYKELGGNLQGNPSKRQFLAKLLDHDSIASLPNGLIVEMQSDAFVNLSTKEAQKNPKKGYLQEWVQGALGSLVDSHPDAIKFRQENPGIDLPQELFTRFHDHPILSQIPLNEFQKICIMNILLYNQDGHAGNYLYSKDSEGQLHITPIDMDAILPWKLSDLVSISTHSRAKEPFTKEALDYIENLDPDYVGEITREMNLSEQAHINAKSLAIVLQKFSQANLSLADIHSFVTDPRMGNSSKLWELMIETKRQAIDSLPKEDKDTYEYAQYVRRRLYQKKSLPSNAEEHLDFYRKNTEKRINKAIEEKYWDIFDRLLKKSIRNIVQTRT